MRKNILKLSIAFAFSLTAVGCENFFDATPGNIVVEEDNFTDKAGVRASMISLINSLQSVADDNIVRSELLGDLMEPTTKASDEYWDLYRYNYSNDSELMSPMPYYNIIVNCNDFLSKTKRYKEANPMSITAAEYKQFMAAAISTRTWAYLTIGKLYGSAVYFDHNLTEKVDLSQFPTLSFDELVDELIFFMLNGVDDVSGIQFVQLDSLMGVNGDVWKRVVPFADMLMCELYLWRKDYANAARYGIGVINGASGLYKDTNADRLTLGRSEFFGEGWRKMFVPSGVYHNNSITMMIYSDIYNQYNDMQKWCSRIEPNEYILKPTDRMVDLYNVETTDEDVDIADMVDPRGDGVTYDDEFGERVIKKYHIDRSAYSHAAPIYIYRAAETHLLIAEAMAGLGEFAAADSLVNVGLRTSYKNVKATYAAPFNTPIFAYDKLRTSPGVRGRVGLPRLISDAPEFMDGLTADDPGYEEHRRGVINKIIADETARELAYEGKRWFTLVRMARNNDDPSIVADVVSQKFPAEERDMYRELLMDPNNWYIKYDLKLNKE